MGNTPADQAIYVLKSTVEAGRFLAGVFGVACFAGMMVRFLRRGGGAL